MTSVGRAQFGIEPAPQEWTVGRHRIADDLARQLAGQIEFDAARQRIGCAQTTCRACGPRTPRSSPGPAATTDDDEGNVEKNMAPGNPTSSGIEARKMPTAPRRPTQEMNSLLTPLKIERCQTQEYRGRPRDQHQHHRHRDGADRLSASRCWPRQQAEQHEHHDLRQPGHGVEKHDHGIVRACLPVADDQAGEINREEAGRVHRIGGGKDDQRAHRHEWRMQTLRQREPIEHERDDPTAGEADDAAKHRIAQECHQRMRPALVADQQDLHQQQREKDRERIVGARLDFQRRRARAGAASSRGH